MNVYIMVDAEGIYKIGKADDPLKRRKQVQSDRRKKVEIYAWLPHDDPYAFESYLHRVYADWNRGQDKEWFTFSKDEVHCIIKEYGFIPSVDAIAAAVKMDLEKEYSLELRLANADVYFAELEKKEILQAAHRNKLAEANFQQKKDLIGFMIGAIMLIYVFRFKAYESHSLSEIISMMILLVFGAILAFMNVNSFERQGLIQKRLHNQLNHF